jgi:hypothetical protein
MLILKIDELIIPEVQSKLIRNSKQGDGQIHSYLVQRVKAVDEKALKQILRISDRAWLTSALSR